MLCMRLVCAMIALATALVGGCGSTAPEETKETVQNGTTSGDNVAVDADGDGFPACNVDDRGTVVLTGQCDCNDDADASHAYTAGLGLGVDLGTPKSRLQLTMTGGLAWYQVMEQDDDPAFRMVGGEVQLAARVALGRLQDRKPGTLQAAIRFAFGVNCGEQSNRGNDQFGCGAVVSLDPLTSLRWR